MASTEATRPLGRRSALPTQLAAELRLRLRAGEWADGDRLPSEHALAAEYEVSRATVRAAIDRLAAEGLVRTRHGLGTFVTTMGQTVRAGLQDLRSISATIAEQGHEPGMEYRVRTQRPCMADEADRLDLDDGSPVFAFERAILSDGEVVAFSYDCLPVGAFPPGTTPDAFTGSVFDRMAAEGVLPDSAVARLHAVRSRSVGWAPYRPSGAMYLLLDQVHYADGEPVAWSKTYFIEGRFEFTIVRR